MNAQPKIQTATPRTDARWLEIHQDASTDAYDRCDSLREFARTLETENARLRAALESLLNLSDARGYLPSQNIAPVEAARAALAVQP